MEVSEVKVVKSTFPDSLIFQHACNTGIGLGPGNEAQHNLRIIPTWFHWSRAKRWLRNVVKPREHQFIVLDLVYPSSGQIYVIQDYGS